MYAIFTFLRTEVADGNVYLLILYHLSAWNATACLNWENALYSVRMDEFKPIDIDKNEGYNT